MYPRLSFLIVFALGCRKSPTLPETSLEEPSMIINHCTFTLESCPPPSSTKGEYEAAYSALDDCLTGCMDSNQTEDRDDKGVWTECALICDQSSCLELIRTPTSIDIQVLE